MYNSCRCAVARTLRDCDCPWCDCWRAASVAQPCGVAPSEEAHRRCAELGCDVLFFKRHRHELWCSPPARPLPFFLFVSWLLLCLRLLTCHLPSRLALPACALGLCSFGLLLRLPTCFRLCFRLVMLDYSQGRHQLKGDLRRCKGALAVWTRDVWMRPCGVLRSSLPNYVC